MYKRHVWSEAMGRREIWNAFMLQYRLYRHAKTVIHKYGMGIIDQGAVSIRKTVLPGMAIPMLKIRRPNGRLIFNMEIAIRR